MRLTVVLLSSILVLAIVSTLVAQYGTSPVPLNQIYSPETLYLMNLLGVTDIFHSGWFVFILAMLGVNLAAAAVERLPSAWHQAKQAVPTALSLESVRTPRKQEKFLHVDLRTQIGREQFRELIQKWSSQKVGKPKAVRDEGGLNELQMVAQEGRFSRLLSYLAYVGFGLIVAGGVLGALKGYEGQMSAMEGARVNFIEIFRGTPPRWPALQETGRLQPGFYLPGFQLEVSKFDVDFYPHAEGEDARPRSVATAVTIYEKGQPVLTTRISPNHPGKYKGMSFFQGPFHRSGKQAAVLTVTDQVNERSEPIGPLVPGDTVKREGFELKLLSIQEAMEEMGPAIELSYKESGRDAEDFWVFKDHPSYDPAHRKKSRFTFTLDSFKPRYEVTVKVSRDPGAPLALAGGLLLALSLLFSLSASLNRYWFFWNPGQVTIVGWSSKLSLFEPKFARASEQIRARISRVDKGVKAIAAEAEHGAS